MRLITILVVALYLNVPAFGQNQPEPANGELLQPVAVGGFSNVHPSVQLAQLALDPILINTPDHSEIGSPAGANARFNHVANLLDDGKIIELETALTAMHKRAVKDRDPSELRALYAKIFATTHQARNAVVAEWRKQLPTSPYAAAAEAWSALAMARQVSGDNKAAHLRRAAQKRAYKAAHDAIGWSADFAPGLEAWLFAIHSSNDEHNLDPVIGRLLAVGPGRETMLVIMRAIDGHWINSGQDLLAFCALYGGMTDDYSADLCLIDAAIKMRRGREFRDIALEYLADANVPGLDDLRAEAALRYDLALPDAADKVIAWHRTLLRPGQPINQHYNEGSWISRKFDRPDYLKEAEADVLEFIDKRLVDDPLNPIMIAEKVRLLYFRYKATGATETLQAARDAWPNATVLGQYKSQVWELGALLEGADRHVSDVASRGVYRENAIAFANDQKYSILMYFNELYAAYQDAKAREEAQTAPEIGAVEPETVLAQVQCPMLRAARVLQALCRIDRNQGSICDVDQPLFAPVPRIVRAGRQGLCDAVAETGLTELAYKPVSLTQIPALQN